MAEIPKQKNMAEKLLCEFLSDNILPGSSVDIVGADVDFVNLAGAGVMDFLGGFFPENNGHFQGHFVRNLTFVFSKKNGDNLLPTYFLRILFRPLDLFLLVFFCEKFHPRLNFYSAVNFLPKNFFRMNFPYSLVDNFVH